MDVMNLGSGIRYQQLTNLDHTAQTSLVNHVLREMELLLTSRQLSFLSNLFEKTLKEYSLSVSENIMNVEEDYREINERLIKQFMETKKLAGLSSKTLHYYGTTLSYLIEFCDKSLDNITTEDVKDWLQYLKTHNGTDGTTLDNYRRNLNSFFNFCVLEGLIYKSPMAKIKPIKVRKPVKQPFTDEELIKIRDELRGTTTGLRDVAFFELLLSSGVRISELTSLDKRDMNLEDRSFYVIGKGNKERKCYFNANAKIALQKYLESRTDNNPALFIGKRGRLTGNAIGVRLRNAGKRCGVEDTHPHRFRRTFATALLRKNVPIEQIRLLLGHAQVSTTQLYALENDNEVKYNHNRYVN